MYTFDLSIRAILWVVRTPRTLPISRVSLMVGRQAGRLLDCGGRIVTGTNPGEREERGGGNTSVSL